MWRNRSERLEPATVRAAVRNVVDAERLDAWLVEMPEPVLIRIVAPLEMLQFQYYLTPPKERHLVRAARVCCAAARAGMAGCPPDMIDAFDRLATVVLDEP